MSSLCTRRLSKELRDLQTNPPVGVSVDSADDFQCWRLILKGAPNTLYEGETFKLQFRFGNSYPLESPEVVFLGSPPVHPHIYSNGHICINILYGQWSPVQTVSSVCLSIQSMLSSCTKKELPPDNSIYIKHASSSPKHTAWAFHDDTV
ncbi:uncharacterized protein VTP21DRAFT_3502 [Calcarisporiella thermophila]|uniref:uncharacterized protein n=1 Tax=Calcarisporiella thermophila TaxID=911321 RepID=UPI0037438143